MKNILYIILIFSLPVFGQGKVVVISKETAAELMGKQFAPDIYFNPILDSLGNWVISEEEVRDIITPPDSDFKIDVKVETLNFVKEAPQVKHYPEMDITPADKIRIDAAKAEVLQIKVVIDAIKAEEEFIEGKPK